MARNAGDALDLQDARRRDPLPLGDSLRRNPKGSAKGDGTVSGFDGSFKGAVAHSLKRKHDLLFKASNTFIAAESATLTVRLMEKNELGHALRAARKAKGLSMAELAEQLGFSTAAIQQWETGKTKPKPNNLVEAARALDADPRRLLAIQAKLHGATETPETPSTVETPETGYRATPNATPDPAPALLPTISSAPRDIEELGITVGGFADDDSAFEMNGQVVDMVPRPPGIAHRKGVFALRVGNESMIPKFEDGERIYAEKQKPAVRDYVVVELYPREEGRPGKSFVKRLVSMDSNRVVVEQFNPRGRLEFDRREIKDIFRVIPWVELLAF